ncbi:MAG: hypothetical protein AAFX54_02950 [Pseudomonadota bacterium]
MGYYIAAMKKDKESEAPYGQVFYLTSFDEAENTYIFGDGEHAVEIEDEAKAQRLAGQLADDYWINLQWEDI